MPDPYVTPTPTVETLSQFASHRDLGPVDEKTALMIKLCEAKTEAKMSEEISSIKENHAGLREKYLSNLRELRDRFSALQFDDVIKVTIGVMGGFLITEFGGKGVAAIKSYWVIGSLFVLLLSILFLVNHFISPSRRKKEILRELNRIDAED